ncbi:leukotriene B4 receptor 1 [Salmo salar]|uniref:Leukotriene B4 receptor 1 n=1 Tax=Salmo salar TaxID=8030 RepID=A0A1S3NA75_SALSA|nr:leukotriene B4 receptor 1-like [Salmo salar]|eukprot:XP_014012016.1 PREDICTED: leukotriene B4 receptor 1-like [Salmo salar]
MASDLSISAAPPLLPSTPSLVSSSPPLSISHQIGISILVLAFVFGFPGNLFVVWSVLCRVRHRSVTCLLVLNLAAADALVLLSAPLFLHFLAGRRGWEFGAVACKTVHYLCCVNMNVSIYLICLMSMDRWLAVARPFLSQRMRTKTTLMAVLLGIWVLAFILALPMPFYRSNLKPFLHKNISMNICMPYHWGSVGHQVFQYLFETVLGFFLPFTFIIVCYTSVICRLRSAMFQRKGRGNRLILLIIGAFALFWLPYHLVNILQVIGLLGGNATLTNAAVSARPNVTAFAFLSSSVNPVLYVFAGSSHIRQAGLSFMAKLFEGTNSEGGTSASFSRSTRSSRSGSTAPDESSALRSLTLKLGWLGKEKDGGGDSGVELRGVEVKVNSKQELKTLTSTDQSE